MKSPGPILREIAEKARVHKATVSRALSGHPDVHEETRWRILQVAGELGYRAHSKKRSVATLGIAIPADQKITRTGYFRELLFAIFEEAGRRGIDIKPVSIEDLAAHGADLYAWCRKKNLESLLLTIGLEEKLKRVLAKLPIPLVLFEDVHPGLPTISVDYEPGLRQALRYLKSLGHHRVALLAHRSTRASHLRKQELFSAIRRECGMVNDAALVWKAEDSGSDAAEILAIRQLRKKNRPGALVTTSEEQTLAVLSACRVLGLEVPGDLSLVGMNDSLILQNPVLPVTVVAFSNTRLVKSLLKSLEQPWMNDRELHTRLAKTIPTRLLIRKSCGMSSD